MIPRRLFLKQVGLGAPALVVMPTLAFGQPSNDPNVPTQSRNLGRELTADIVIIGGGLGGCAAALAAARNGLRVILTEETDWIGGQLTSQAVPPDENPWIETFGCTRRYRAFRTAVRQCYRDHYPLTD